MSDSSATKTHPEPLFRLELKANGGVLAPRTVDELRAWVQKEFQFWSWVEQNSGVNREAINQARTYLANARDRSQQAANEAAAGGNPRDRVEEARRAIEHAYVQLGLPHSTSMLGKEVERMRQESPAVALGFLFPQMREHRQHRFDSNSADGWYGFVLGLFRAYGEPSGLRQLKGQRESFDDFLAESKKLHDERRDELDRIENDVAGALQRAADDADTRSQEFDRFMEESKRKYAEALQTHRGEMETLRKVFREEMALRAPVEYWEARATLHESRATRLREKIGFAVVGVGISVALTAHWALKSSAQPYTPDAWRLALLAFVAAMGVWVVRLLVRTLLSHMHLSTDAAERVTMIKTYLSLLEAQKLPENEDRKLILQALFRHSPDGMVKDEGLPGPLWDALTRPKA